jgi:Zn-dependent peptidase ImmA (M78 family)
VSVGSSKRPAEAAARLARQELGWGLEAPFKDVLKLVEDRGGVPITIAELPEGMSGAFLRRRGRPFIVLNGTEHPVRQRFTLAHEFGHCRLGHGEVVDGPNSFASNVTDPDEIAANQFAAEFLAPQQAVIAWMEANNDPQIDLEVVVRLAVEFGVSAAVARYRLDAARYIHTQKQRSALDADIVAGRHRDLIALRDLSEVRDTIDLARDNLPRIPSRLRENAIGAYQAGLLNVDRLARMLRRDSTQTAQHLDERGVKQVIDEERDW